ncbi:HD-GYP domain-containing protein [Treponema sp.]|uniref:HD-GYP domain-containing protein n=1 Tax=Treponema sp. TaxID=166 RepID=UPI00388EBAD5
MNGIDHKFLKRNVSQVNGKVQNIYMSLNLLPLALYLGNLGNAWHIPEIYLVKIQVLITSLFLLNFLIFKFANMPNLSKYLGIFACTTIVSIIAANGRVAIYISYGFFPFLASLYFSNKCTRIVSLYSWIAMMVSLYIKTRITKQCEPFTGEIYSPNLFFIRFSIGFTIELFFTHLLAMMMTRQNQKSLRNLISNIDSVNNMNISLAEKNIELEETQSKIIKFISTILNSHDMFTGNHVLHTQTYVGIIARELQEQGLYLADLTDENISMLCNAALLHDIGKIHIPEGILNKPGKFTPQEFDIMKSHPEEGHKILEVLPPIADGKFNRIAEEVCLYHHEKWDGTGYPSGLSGKDIPLFARIMAAADVLDALLSRRLYKQPMSIDKAMEIFKELKGVQFEPCISDAVLAKKETIENCDNYFKQEEDKNNVTELAWWKKYHEYIDSQKQ